MWVDTCEPMWLESAKYRIKPEPKPDVVVLYNPSASTEGLSVKRDTPRTNAAEHNMGSIVEPHYVVDVDCSRQLERELEDAINALRAALAEPKQEPIAWYHDDFGVLEFSRHERVGFSPLYTAPPRREWVGLTDEEIDEIGRAVIGFNSLSGWENEFGLAIEAKLKEKNSG